MADSTKAAGWLPPEEYVRTIANATMYGCLYFTDTRGRPLGLRSTIDPDPWQWPGGNTDKGETPWETAVRECKEETGIAFRGECRLIGMNFAPAGGGWPLCRVGFVFDGGTLTDAQLDAIVLDPAEHTEWRVLTIDQWRTVMDPLTFDRLADTDASRRTSTTMYAEHEPVQCVRPKSLEP
ncbi:NUDIX domain-containing protein [Kitasatospora sp. NBC_01539]|uniref:NUDIX domain-containing protein n=1 Tax=Kitasatospora sp. NBC_01539 TaxID=2903577 RepID=UPI00386020F0